MTAAMSGLKKLLYTTISTRSISQSAVSATKAGTSHRYAAQRRHCLSSRYTARTAHTSTMATDSICTVAARGATFPGLIMTYCVQGTAVSISTMAAKSPGVLTTGADSTPTSRCKTCLTLFILPESPIAMVYLLKSTAKLALFAFSTYPGRHFCRLFRNFHYLCGLQQQVLTQE